MNDEIVDRALAAYRSVVEGSSRWTFSTENCMRAAIESVWPTAEIEQLRAEVERLRGAIDSGKDYRKMLADVGGWDNELVNVPAGGVRKIIEDLEASRARCDNLIVAMNELSKQDVAIVDENAKLRADNAKLREALKFYAQGSLYQGGFDNDGEGHFDMYGYEIIEDDGKTARAAIGSNGTEGET